MNQKDKWKEKIAIITLDLYQGMCSRYKLEPNVFCFQGRNT